jgi:hypothetical protein
MPRPRRPTRFTISELIRVENRRERLMSQGRRQKKKKKKKEGRRRRRT